MRKPSLLFYCQHSLGMGHLVRSFALVRALAEQFHVVFLNGGRLPENVVVPSGVELVQLPPVGMNEDATLSSLVPELSLEECLRLREHLMLSTAQSARPSAVIVELFPFGRKKFRGELVKLFDAVRAGGTRRVPIICSLRDILIGGRRDQQAHDDRTAACLNEYFDAVLVHSDPDFARIDETFRPSVACDVPVHYTGFVLPHESETPRAGNRERRILVSAGGGLVGGPLLRAAAGAHRQLWPSLGIPMTLVAGPFLPEAEWAEFESTFTSVDGLTLMRSVPDLSRIMRNVSWSVSQCGYNTAMDVLASGVAGLFVPFSRGQETEQTFRAERLEACGAALAVSLPEAGAADALADALLDLIMFRPRPIALDVAGAARSAQIVAEYAGVAGAPARRAQGAG